jgi:hypothetical protein
MMEVTDILKQVKYGTLEIMAKDLADQIDDHDGFYIGTRKPDPEDIIRHAKLVIAFGHVIKIYCGEGGIPIYGLHHGQFERLVDKYHPEIKEGLRKKW